MTNQLNGAANHIAPVPQADEIVVKNLSDLPKSERRQITSELMRIHNLVNATESDLRKMSGKDKADKPQI